jgi:myo-inositol-1(or 4)-monophosphatase
MKTQIFFKKVKRTIQKELKRNANLRFNFKLKDDSSPITEMDKLFNEKIHKLSKKFFKEVIFISEESELPKLKNIKDEFVLIVDPLDGTENFKSGLKEWGVSISIYKNKKHIDSFIFLPELNIELIYSKKYKFNQIDSRIIGISSSINEHAINLIKDYKNAQIRIMGCAIYNLYNVCVGNYKEYYAFNNHSWDIQASLNLIKKFTNKKIIINGELYSGKLLDPNKEYSISIF